jgi:hypothetical protein
MKFTAFLAGAFITTLLSSPLYAGTLVPNGDFENPADGSVDNYKNNNDNSTFIPDFTFDDSSSVSGTLGNRFGGTTDGDRVAFFNVAPGDSATATTNSSVFTITAGENYTLTVALGNTPGTGNYSQPSEFSLSFLAGASESTATVINTTPIDGDSITDGTIKDFSVTLSAAQAAAYLNEGLYVQVGDTDDELNGDDSQALFDNVRVSEAIPEPSTYALIALGAIGFVVAGRLRKLAA